MPDTDAWQVFDAAARVARAIQAEIDSAGLGNPLRRENDRLRNLILHLAAHDPLRDVSARCEPCSEIRQMLKDSGKQY